MSESGSRKVASGVIEALKTSPLALSLIVIVGVFMYFIYSSVEKQRAASHEIQKILLERCK